MPELFVCASGAQQSKKAYRPSIVGWSWGVAQSANQSNVSGPTQRADLNVVVELMAIWDRSRLYLLLVTAVLCFVHTTDCLEMQEPSVPYVFSICLNLVRTAVIINSPYLCLEKAGSVDGHNINRLLLSL